jgi:SPP1 family predicted phage head-tail adaptor
MLRSGRYRHPVTLQQATEVRDGHGQPVQTWSTFKPWRCAIDPLSGREFFAAQQVSAETTHRLTGHYVSGVSPKMRVRDDVAGRIFRIEAVLNFQEMGRELQLMCVEVLA